MFSAALRPWIDPLVLLTAEKTAKVQIHTMHTELTRNVVFFSLPLENGCFTEVDESDRQGRDIVTTASRCELAAYDDLMENRCGFEQARYS